MGHYSRQNRKGCVLCGFVSEFFIVFHETISAKVSSNDTIKIMGFLTRFNKKIVKLKKERRRQVWLPSMTSTLRKKVETHGTV